LLFLAGRPVNFLAAERALETALKSFGPSKLFWGAFRFFHRFCLQRFLKYLELPMVFRDISRQPVEKNHYN